MTRGSDDEEQRSGGRAGRPAPELPATVATTHGEALLAGQSGGECQAVMIEGPDMGRAARIEPGAELVVGSDPSCHLVLTDERVSRRHLALRREESARAAAAFVVRDLGSRNGTLYAGSAITEVAVAAGATFKLGRSYLRIQPRHEPLVVDPSQARRFGDLVAESLAMREVFAVLELAAASDVTLLLEGETGTGKELAARAVHEASPRRRGPFVTVDCGALPPDLVESELFGHLRGAFTGAARDRQGAFLRADGGTLLLDELDSVPPAAQARLLRAVEERRVRPVGADDERAFDARIIGGARSDLATQVARGAFRPDLFYRLSVLRVTLPPLRDRREDLAPIVAELLRRRGFGAPFDVTGGNLDRLVAHDWPGNVRELRNVIDRAVALSPGARAFSELRLAVGGTGEREDGLAVRSDLRFTEAKQQLIDVFERRYLLDLLARCGQNISRAAREADLDRKHLRRLLVRHGLIDARGCCGDD